MSEIEDTARDVLFAILRHSGPLPVAEVGERLAAALGGSHGDAREATMNALYFGFVALSSDRVVSLTDRARENL